MRPENNIFIRVFDISHLFYPSKENPIHVINHIDLSIPRGQFISLIGPSGCGKTTLLKIIGGLNSPTKGEILIETQSPQNAQAQGRIGFVFQEPVLFPWRTVIQNINLPYEVLLIKKKFRDPKELIEIMGLEGFENYLPRELSGGMKSRVAIARVLSYEPDILFMDEPFANLDEITRDVLNLELLNIWERSGLTVIYATHSISEAVFLSDRIIVLSSRPARIIKDIKVNFKRPRNFGLRKHMEFVDLVEDLKRFLCCT